MNTHRCTRRIVDSNDADFATETDTDGTDALRIDFAVAPEIRGIGHAKSWADLSTS